MMNIYPIQYFAPVPWFALANQEETLLLEAKAHYKKQELTNRMCIQTANGVLSLVIPVLRTGERKPVQDKKIAYDTDWQKIHWKSLESAYRRSPYFEYYEHKFQPFYQKKYPFLLDFNQAILSVCLDILKMPKQIQLTETYESPDFYTRDYRNAFDAAGKTLPESFLVQPYSQVFGEFVAGLSIFDLICNQGPNSLALLNRSV